MIPPALKLAALPDADAITLTWRLFGNNGVVRFQDRPIIEQFPMAAPKILHWPWRAAMFKTLYRNNGIYGKLGVHRPRSPDKARVERARWFDGAGRELDDRFRRQQIFSPFGRDNYTLAQLNHYPLGTMESYIVKRDRGRAVHDADALGMSYWVDRNWCVEKDDTIAALKPARARERARLAADETLSKLHQAAVDWRKARFEKLMEDEANRALFGRLLMCPPSQPIPAGSARFLFSFAQKGVGRAD